MAFANHTAPGLSRVAKLMVFSLSWSHAKSRPDTPPTPTKGYKNCLELFNTEWRSKRDYG
jgi:hypothetical protein